LLGYGESFSAGFWTLCIEMQFYLLFCLLLGLAQRLTRFGKQDRTAGWALAVVFFPLATASLWAFNLDHLYENWVLFFFCMFFLGSIVWWSLEGRLSAWFFWAYVAMMVARLTWQWGVEIAVALAAGLIIYGVGRAGHLTDWLRWRPLMYLGRISYSLYLIHYSVIHLVVHAGHKLTGESAVAAFGWTAVALVLSLLAAHVLNVLVEAPTARLAARLKLRPRLAERAVASRADGSDAPALSVGQA
jgi:peptidoglycan/LPS O-acetylase OafA/YrhL